MGGRMSAIAAEKTVIAVVRAVLSTGGGGTTTGAVVLGIVFLIFLWVKRRGWVT